MSDLTITGTLTQLQCPSCGMNYAIPTALYRDRKDQGGGWYCPAGCHIGFFGRPKVKDLEKKIARLEEANRFHADRAERYVEDLQHTRRSLAATKGVVTKMKRRIVSGKCPCCKRTFEDLRDHMETAHPDWSDED